MSAAPATDPRVDAYIAAAPAFARPILEHARAAVHAGCPEATETIKWRMPFFVVDGRPLAFMAAFKAHCGFGFWRARAIAGEGPAFGAERTDGGTDQFGRLEKVSDLPGKRALAALVKDAAKALAAVRERPLAAGRARTRPDADVPVALARALARHARARSTFDALAPSHRREYAEWIAEAKRDDTRERRVAQAIEWLAEGKSRNWKYEPGRKAPAG